MEQVVETADEFFARARTDEEVSALLIEHPENRLALATREARALKFDARRREHQAAARRGRLEAAARFDANRVPVDAEARASLPSPRRGPHKPVVHARWAARFWDRVVHVDVSDEKDGYRRFAAQHRYQLAAAVLKEWKSAPYDPITPEEYAEITRHGRGVAARRVRDRAENKRRHAIARGKIIAPAGMTLERAEQIARLALDLSQSSDSA